MGHIIKNWLTQLPGLTSPSPVRRGAYPALQSKSEGSRTWSAAADVSSQWKAAWLEAPEMMVFQSECKGRGNWYPSWKAAKEEECPLVCSIWTFIWLNEDEGGPCALFRLLIPMWNSAKKQPHWNAQNNVWPTIWAPCGPVKLIHTLTTRHRIS